MGRCWVVALCLGALSAFAQAESLEKWKIFQNDLPTSYYQTITSNEKLYGDVPFYNDIKYYTKQGMELCADTLDLRVKYLRNYMICSCPQGQVSIDILPDLEHYKEQIKNTDVENLLGTCENITIGVAQDLHQVETCPRAFECKGRFHQKILDYISAKYDDNMRNSYWQGILTVKYPQYFKPVVPFNFKFDYQQYWNNFIVAFNNMNNPYFSSWVFPRLPFKNYDPFDFSSSFAPAFNFPMFNFPNWNFPNFNGDFPNFSPPAWNFPNFNFLNFNLPNTDFPNFNTFPDIKPFPFPTFDFPTPSLRIPDGSEMKNGTFDLGSGIKGTYQTYTFGGPGQPHGQVVTASFGSPGKGGFSQTFSTISSSSETDIKTPTEPKETAVKTPTDPKEKTT